MPMPNIHFMITPLSPTRGCEEPFEPGIDVEVEVTIGRVKELPEELLEELLEELGAVQHLVQILPRSGESHTVTNTHAINTNTFW